MKVRIEIAVGFAIPAMSSLPGAMMLCCYLFQPH